MKKCNKNYYIFSFSENITNIEKQSVSSGISNITSILVRLVITLFRTSIIARILNPEDYGLFTMVLVVASFAVIFKDLGLSSATVREKEITHAQVSNLFWINAMVGFLSMLLVMAISPFISRFYNDSRLINIAMLLSISFFFGGLAVQHQALLKRQMKFGKLAIITIIASLLSSVAGVILAIWGYGYWTLVWMVVLENGFILIGAFMAVRWLPGCPSRGSGIKKFLKVGLDVAGLNAFSTLTKHIDKIIIGRVSSATLLGIYGKGEQVPRLIAEQFRLACFSVAFPALSSLQSERKRFVKFYQTFLTTVSWATMGLASFSFVFAETIVLTLLGPQWTDSVIYMKLFSINAFIMPMITTIDQVPLALGYSRNYLFAGVIRSVCVLLFVGIGAIKFGTVGAVCGVILSNFVYFLPFFLICTKKSDIKLVTFSKSIYIPIIVCVSASALFLSIIPISSLNLIYSITSGLVFLLVIFISFCVVDYLGIGYSIGFSKYLLKKLLKRI